MTRALPFVIEAFPRCGTHMLRTALDRHPQIRCAGEIFNRDAAGCEARTAKEVGDVLSRWLRPGPDVSGFCVHRIPLGEPSYPWRHNSPLDWHRLARRLHEQGIRVVALDRRNLFRRHVSHLVARKTHRWQFYSPASSPKPVRVIRKDFEADVDWYRLLWQRARSLAPAVLMVAYESLVSDWEYHIGRIQDYLGVVRVAIQPRTIKPCWPLSEVVENYEDLKRHYAGSKLEEWFDE